MKYTCHVHNHRNIVVSDGANLFKALRKANIPIAHSCDGEGVCGQCWVQVNPAENLSKENSLETRVKRANGLPEQARLSCLVRVRGHVTIQTSYW